MSILGHMTHRAAWRLDTAWTRLTMAYRRRAGYNRPLRIQIYRGYGDPDGRYRIGGRVIAGRPVTPHEDPIDWWKNTAQMARRFLSPEVPYATVRILVGQQAHEITTDDEGYFWFEGDSAELVAQGPAAQDSGLLYPIRVQLVDPVPNDTEVFDGVVQLSGSPLGVISDIDDTIIASGATNALRLVKTTLTYDATRRRVFDGIAQFYRALHPAGADEHEPVPFWYVSSSAWNLYDFFEAIWRINDIPDGSYLLRDLGVTEDHLFKGSHEDHKLDAIRGILRLCTGTGFILIGDTGQRDPYIYAQLAREFPERIRAIYLREVTGPEARPELDALASQIAGHTPMLISPTLDDCVEHAVTKGWLDRADADAVLDTLEPPLRREAQRRAWTRRAKKPAAVAAAGVAATAAIWGAYRWWLAR